METMKNWRTRGAPGAYISVKGELRRPVKNVKSFKSKMFDIKVGGDGTKISRISSFIIISVSIKPHDEAPNQAVNDKVQSN